MSELEVDVDIDDDDEDEDENDREDVLGPLPSPGQQSTKGKPSFRTSTSSDDDTANQQLLEDDSSLLQPQPSPHIHGTRRLGKSTLGGGGGGGFKSAASLSSSTATSASTSMTQHIRHRSSLFWLQTNGFANIEDFTESDWDAESFITRRKELQFALEKLPVFAAKPPPLHSSGGGDGDVSAAKAGSSSLESFDLLTAKLAQEEADYELEVCQLLQRRRLQRAFATWVMVRECKPRSKAAAAAAAAAKKKKQQQKPKKKMQPPLTRPSASSSSSTVISVPDGDAIAPLASPVLEEDADVRQVASSTITSAGTLEEEEEEDEEEEVALQHGRRQELEEEGTPADPRVAPPLSPPHPLLVLRDDKYVGPDFAPLASETEPVAAAAAAAAPLPVRSTLVSRVLQFRNGLQQDRSRPLSSGVLARAVSALGGNSRVSSTKL